MARPLRLALTTGDPDGIGPEVTAKALVKLGPQKGVQFFLWRNHQFPEKDLRRLSRSFKVKTVSSWSEAIKSTSENPKELIDIATRTNAARWVEEAAHACFFRHLDALATAPLSKPAIKASGLQDIGHTDILKRVSQTKSAFMTFIGKHFNVFLATGHLSLKDVSSKISQGSLEEALLLAHSFAQEVETKARGSRPVAVLGLNPHAGDEGLIGTEEQEILIPLLERLNSNLKGRFVGPLVPDAAFMEQNRGKYSTFFALYHDQGLIPFKAIHGQNGVHITWGLPFVRTSVDHGTAKDIAGKDKADATSMKLAIEWAIKLARSKRSEL